MIHGTAEIDAPAATVWDVWTGVADWSRWSSTTRSTRLLSADGSGFGLGSRVRIHQSQLPANVWEVTVWEPVTRFVWVARQSGITTTATHDLEDLGDGRTRVHASVLHEGLLAGVVGGVTGRLTRTYVAREVVDLKRRAEGGPDLERRPPPDGMRR